MPLPVLDWLPRFDEPVRAWWPRRRPGLPHSADHLTEVVADPKPQSTLATVANWFPPLNEPLRAWPPRRDTKRWSHDASSMPANFNDPKELTLATPATLANWWKQWEEPVRTIWPSRGRKPYPADGYTEIVADPKPQPTLATSANWWAQWQEPQIYWPHRDSRLRYHLPPAAMPSLFPDPYVRQINYVSGTTTTATTTPVSVSYSPRVGNTLIIVVAFSGTSGNVSSISDGAGGIYQLVRSQPTSTTVRVQIWSGVVLGSVSTITINLNANNTVAVAVGEYEGNPLVDSPKNVAGTTATSSMSISGGGQIPPDAFTVAGFACVGAPTITGTSGLLRLTAANGTAVSVVLMDKTSSLRVTETLSANLGASEDYAAGAFTLSPETPANWYPRLDEPRWSIKPQPTHNLSYFAIDAGELALPTPNDLDSFYPPFERPLWGLKFPRENLTQVVTDPKTVSAETISIDKWFEQAVDISRKPATQYLQAFYSIDTAELALATQNDIDALSLTFGEPVRTLKPLPIGAYPSTFNDPSELAAPTAPVESYWVPLSEPQRKPSPLAIGAYQHWVIDPAELALATAPTLTSWFRPLTEPAWKIKPLPTAAYPFFTIDPAELALATPATVSNWFPPLSEPAWKLKPLGVGAYLNFVIDAGELAQPTANYLDAFYPRFQEPRWQVKPLPIACYPSAFDDPGELARATANILDSFYPRFSEPRWGVKPLPVADYLHYIIDAGDLALPTAPTVDSWFAALAEPRWQVKALPIGAYPADFDDPAELAKATQNILDSFYPRLSEPRWNLKPLPAGAYPYFTLDPAELALPTPPVESYWCPFSEPQRRLSPLPVGALPSYFANSLINLSTFAADQILAGWWKPLSEPRLAIAPLATAARPTQFDDPGELALATKNILDSFYPRFQEPSWSIKPLPIGAYPYFILDPAELALPTPSVESYWSAFSEPQRRLAPLPIAAFPAYFANALLNLSTFDSSQIMAGWWKPFSEPRWAVKPLPVANYLHYIIDAGSLAAPTPPTVENWYSQLSEPRWQVKPLAIGAYPWLSFNPGYFPTDATVENWLVSLSEPQRKMFRNDAALFPSYFVNPNFTLGTFADDQIMQGWWRAWSEPLWTPKPLPTGARPSFEIDFGELEVPTAPVESYWSPFSEPVRQVPAFRTSLQRHYPDPVLDSRVLTAFASTRAANGTGSSFNITGITSATGDTAFVLIGLADSTQSVSSISDNATGGSSKYQFVTAVNNGTIRLELWRTNIGGIAGPTNSSTVGAPTTCTVNLSGSSEFEACYETYSGGQDLVNVTARTINNSNPSLSDTTVFNNDRWIVGFYGLGTATFGSSLAGSTRTTRIGTTAEIAAMDSVRSQPANPGATSCQANNTTTQWCAIGIELTTLPVAIYPNCWMVGLSEPVRFSPPLRSSWLHATHNLTQLISDPKDLPTANILDSWWNPLAEPRWAIKPLPIADYPHWFIDPEEFTVPTAPTVDSWFAALTEPQRQIKPLPIGARPSLFPDPKTRQVNYISGTTVTASATPIAVSYSPQIGHLLVVVVAVPDTTHTVSSVTDDGGTVYRQLGGAVSGTAVRVTVYGGKVNAAVSTITINLSGNDTAAVAVGEYEGGGGFDLPALTFNVPNALVAQVPAGTPINVAADAMWVGGFAIVGNPSISEDNTSAGLIRLTAANGSTITVMLMDNTSSVVNGVPRVKATLGTASTYAAAGFTIGSDTAASWYPRFHEPRWQVKPLGIGAYPSDFDDPAELALATPPVESYWYPFSEPRWQLKPLPVGAFPHLFLDAAALASPTTNVLDSWFLAMSEPRWSPKILVPSLHPVLSFDPADFPTSATLASWWKMLDEPRRDIAPLSIGAYPYFTIDPSELAAPTPPVESYWFPFTEPQRQVSPLAPGALPSLFLDPSALAAATEATLANWWRMLEEPRWNLKPLPVGAYPYFTIDPSELALPSPPVESFWLPFSEPQRRISPLAIGALPNLFLDAGQLAAPTAATLASWWKSLSEPRWSVPPRSERYPSWFVDTAELAKPTVPTVESWYEALSEPRWSLKPLPIAAYPFIFADPHTRLALIRAFNAQMALMHGGIHKNISHHMARMLHAMRGGHPYHGELQKVVTRHLVRMMPRQHGELKRKTIESLVASMAGFAGVITNSHILRRALSATMQQFAGGLSRLTRITMHASPNKFAVRFSKVIVKTTSVTLSLLPRFSNRFKRILSASPASVAPEYAATVEMPPAYIGSPLSVATHSADILTEELYVAAPDAMPTYSGAISTEATYSADISAEVL
jgi:hypothetical protein